MCFVLSIQYQAWFKICQYYLLVRLYQIEGRHRYVHTADRVWYYLSAITTATRPWLPNRPCLLRCCSLSSRRYRRTKLRLSRPEHQRGVPESSKRTTRKPSGIRTSSRTVDPRRDRHMRYVCSNQSLFTGRCLRSLIVFYILASIVASVLTGKNPAPLGLGVVVELEGGA